jgi:hypothetical protein
LTQSYGLELEAVLNWLANRNSLECVRADELKRSLAADVQKELRYPVCIDNRIKTLVGKVSERFDFRPCPTSIQPCFEFTDLVRVIKGLIGWRGAEIAQD